MDLTTLTPKDLSAGRLIVRKVSVYPTPFGWIEFETFARILDQEGNPQPMVRLLVSFPSDILTRTREEVIDFFRRIAVDHLENFPPPPPPYVAQRPSPNTRAWPGQP